MSADYFAEHLQGRLLGIFRGLDPQETVRLCRQAWNEKVPLVEVPVQRPDAMPSLHAAVAAAEGTDGRVGAGTVTTLDQLEAVLAAGAEFIVSPGLHPEVAAECRRRGVPHLPGVATSSEIAAAVGFGCSWVKAFPAKQLGPGWIRAQHGPFPDVSFVATGGIDAGNAAEFLAAGCRAVAVGSAFSSPEAIAALRAAVAA